MVKHAKLSTLQPVSLGLTLGFQYYKFVSNVKRVPLTLKTIIQNYITIWTITNTGGFENKILKVTFYKGARFFTV